MLAYQNGELCLRGCSIAEMARDLEAPFFLIDERRLRDNCMALQKGLAATGLEPRIRYCAKTNNEAGVLRVIRDCGLDVLISHPAEALLAAESGFSMGHMAYQRPVITEPEIVRMLKAGIHLFHAFRLEDLDVLEKGARHRGCRVRVNLRLRALFSPFSLSPLRILSSRHGFRKEEVPAAMRRVVESRWLEPQGLHFYLGAQQQSHRRYGTMLRRVAGLAREVERIWATGFEEINVGGGAPSFSLQKGLFRRREPELSDLNEAPARLEDFARGLAQMVFRAAETQRLAQMPALAAEPGRCIAGNAGLLIARVEAVSGKWVFLGASRNYLGESPLFFARLVLPLTRRRGVPQVRYHLSGDTLNTMDFLGLHRPLETLRPGQFLAVCDAGAYSISRASRYAGLPPAVHLLRADGSLQQIRRAEGLHELTASMT